MKTAAGLLLFSRRGQLEVFSFLPADLFGCGRIVGAWTPPKGEIEDGKVPLAAAQREFAEETRFAVDGEFHALSRVRQSSGKPVHTWAARADCNSLELCSKSFSME